MRKGPRLRRDAIMALTGATAVAVIWTLGSGVDHADRVQEALTSCRRDGNICRVEQGEVIGYPTSTSTSTTTEETCTVIIGGFPVHTGKTEAMQKGLTCQ